MFFRRSALWHAVEPALQLARECGPRRKPRNFSFAPQNAPIPIKPRDEATLDANQRLLTARVSQKHKRTANFVLGTHKDSFHLGDGMAPCSTACSPCVILQEVLRLSLIHLEAHQWPAVCPGLPQCLGFPCNQAAGGTTGHHLLFTLH